MRKKRRRRRTFLMIYNRKRGRKIKKKVEIEFKEEVCFCRWEAHRRPFHDVNRVTNEIYLMEANNRRAAVLPPLTFFRGERDYGETITLLSKRRPPGRQM
jgi:hypothetical protein